MTDVSGHDLLRVSDCEVLGCLLEAEYGSPWCREHQPGSITNRPPLALVDVPEDDKSEEAEVEVVTTVRKKWSRETVIDAIQRWAQEHDGQPPTQRDWGQSGDYWPAFSTAVSRVGPTWGETIRAAGFEPRKKGSHKSSGREPKARKTTGVDRAPDSESPVSPPGFLAEAEPASHPDLDPDRLEAEARKLRDRAETLENSAITIRAVRATLAALEAA